MKYTVDIQINKSREETLALFDNTENLKHWMPGLIRFEHMSGDAGQIGAKSKIIMSMGKRECEMIETIEVRDLPNEFTAVYETPGMWNLNKNTFVEVDVTTTKWISYNEFKSDRLMMKLMMFFMPGAFKKESLKFMQRFKSFAEKEQ